MLTLPIAAMPLVAASCSNTKANNFLFRFYNNKINRVPSGLLGINYFANTNKLMGYNSNELAYLNVTKTTNPNSNDNFTGLTINKINDFDTTNSLTPTDPASFKILTYINQESLNIFKADNSTDAVAVTEKLMGGVKFSNLSLIKGIDSLTANSTKFVYSYINKLPSGAVFNAAKGIPGTNDSVIACDSKGKVHFITDLKNSGSTLTTASGTFDPTSRVVGMQIIKSTGDSYYVVFATDTKLYTAEVNATNGTWTKGVTNITPSNLPNNVNFFKTYQTSDNKVYITSNQSVYKINANVTAATQLKGLTYTDDSKTIPYNIHTILKDGNKYYFTTETKGILTSTGLSGDTFQI